jgi:hypothetical protein
MTAYVAISKPHIDSFVRVAAFYGIFLMAGMDISSFVNRETWNIKSAFSVWIFERWPGSLYGGAPAYEAVSAISYEQRCFRRPDLMQTRLTP